MEARRNRLAAGVIALCLAWPGTAMRAGEFKQLFPCDLEKLNAGIHGKVLDFTANHGADHRIWSESLSRQRDLYVYLPPDYDSQKSYPLLIWLHGFGGDETQFCRQVVAELDTAIASGAMPPVIAAAPDGSYERKWRPWCPGSWYINSRQGNWEDYIVRDVPAFMAEHFKIRPERDAHILAGWSMGGFGSYNLGMKHPDKFRMLVGIYPNLNLRYVDRDGHWGTRFNPETATMLEDISGRWLIGKYPKYKFPVNVWAVFKPVWGTGRECIERMSQENPIEMLDRLDVKNGQFDMFLAYGQQDEYHVNNQVDSFIHRAGQRGLKVWVRYDPDGHHSSEYVNDCMPDVLNAVGAKLRERLPDLRSQADVAAATPARDQSSGILRCTERKTEATAKGAVNKAAILILPQ